MSLFSLEDMRSRFFSAVLSDCLDQVGHTRQALASRIRPLDEASVMVGRARTALYTEVFHVVPGENPYALEIALVDSLQRDEIPVFACGLSGRIAPWGELLSTAAAFRGASGALMDGCVRDTRAIRAMGFPVFHGGIAPLDSKGRGVVSAIDVPIECGGVTVRSGDLVFGDADGVVIVPREVEDEVLRLAHEKVSGERNTLADLKAGHSLADVFARYGIL
ncbi:MULTISPECIES: RraA family protein [Chelatococcus]|uniref:Putative 4-hydroxy-4-methyl-2-oxoglutarate aldolase n=1 Tax=Chelatococcus caeni TaxID=1348468 RepID=A0A840C208_9HYPH|nr:MULTISPECIES: RraA family protein [Chelatococcus]ALA20083.1 dimethylmenaquinone methyltransferase [Chelatococcus sp. CO-6]MBB4018843.1 regulator of RNase E activity RraA [Chelatococcus caeni]